MDSNTQPQGTPADMDCMKAPEPGPQHAWLQELVGDWTYSIEMVMGPDQPSMTSEGRETVRAIGPYWILGESSSKMPDGEPATMIITLGYDEKQGWVGTWFGSMMTMLWHYKGELSADGTTLTLRAEGPAMAPGAEPGSTALYEDIIEKVDDSTRRHRSRGQSPDGSWFEFMRGEYKKAG